ncbi:hypothetical protein BHM03_00052544 [Ensete ventricosum]|nr:hypothetical protein BHM03_00052544 [Ensete ventricosum]
MVICSLRSILLGNNRCNYSLFVCSRSTISREKFEELCADLWERAFVPVKDVLRHSGLKIDEIYAVELIGGATRVPKLQVTLKSVYICSRYVTRNLSAPIKANLHFSLSRSGVLSLDRVEAVIEISEWVEVPKKNTTLENNGTNSFNVSTETSPGNSSQDNTENLNSADSINGSSNSTKGEQASDIITEKVLKKKTFRVPLKVYPE